MASYKYDSVFFDFVDGSSKKSATVFLPKVYSTLSPHSVLDVGCGRGVWLATWKELGVDTVMGVDGSYVDIESLHILPEEFTAQDITQKFNLNNEYDLVQCLEVAEHISEKFTDVLIENIIKHGNIIMFSAAQPGQGGEQHVNEQTVQYWMNKFKESGYDAFDFPRQVVKDLAQIEPWYRYNTLLYANRAGQEKLSDVVLKTRINFDNSHQYTSFIWKVRCAILRNVPTPIIHFLAKIKHYCVKLIKK